MSAKPIATDLTDADKAVLIELLTQTIARDRFPLSPRIRRLKVILAKPRSTAVAARAAASAEAARGAERGAQQEAEAVGVLVRFYEWLRERWTLAEL